MIKRNFEMKSFFEKFQKNSRIFLLKIFWKFNFFRTVLGPNFKIILESLAAMIFFLTAAQKVCTNATWLQSFLVYSALIFSPLTIKKSCSRAILAFSQDFSAFQ